jgi:hypothetical protein
MTEAKRGFRYRVAATLLILLGCSACGDQAATPTSGASRERSSSSRDHNVFTEVGEPRNAAEICKSARSDIAAGDRRLETAFTEWRSRRDDFYDAQKSAFLSGSNRNGSPSETSDITSSIASVGEAGGPSQKDSRLDSQLLEEKQSSFYAALRDANETLAKYDQIGCVVSDDVFKKRREYNDLLGRD